jgi:hypothetical protein
LKYGQSGTEICERVHHHLKKTKMRGIRFIKRFINRISSTGFHQQDAVHQMDGI